MVSLCLKDFTVSAWFIIVISQLQIRYGHSADNVRGNVSGYGLGQTVFVLSENCDACFYSC